MVVVVQIIFLLGVLSPIWAIPAPLSEEELQSLDEKTRYNLLHAKPYQHPHHSTKVSFKAKYVSNSGYIYDNVQVLTETIKVEATHRVSDSTLYKAANIIAHMVRHMPSDVFSGIATRSHGVGIFTEADTITVFPENAHLADSPQCHGTCSGHCSNTCTVDGRKFYSISGLTNTRSSVLDKNVACTSDDPYSHKENILVHEFGHLVMKYMPQHWRDRIIYTYNYCKQHNVWSNAYGMANSAEYWAEATSSFFLTIIRDGPAAGMNKCNFRAICTSEQAARDWLKLRDPWIFDVLSHVYTNGHPTTPSGLRVCMSSGMQNNDPRSLILNVLALACVTCMFQNVQGERCARTPEQANIVKAKSTPSVLQNNNPHRYHYCYWLIVANDSCDSSVQLYVEQGYLSYLQIYDGPSTSFKAMAIPSLPRNITSTGHFVLIQYYYQYPYKITYKDVKTDATASFTSAAVSNTINNRCENNNRQILMATYGNNFISSPGFPQHRNYGNSLRCTWLVISDDPCHAVIQVTFINLWTEQGYDFVRIYDGSTVSSPVLGAFSGKEVPSSVVSSGDSVLITFISDNVHDYTGFKLMYENVFDYPVIHDNITKIQNTSNLSLRASFTSLSPIRSVQWFKNGILVYDDTHSFSNYAKYTCDQWERNIRDSTLNLTSISSEDIFGIYMLSVQNKIGFAERFVEFNKQFAVTFGTHNTTINADSITLQVPAIMTSKYSDVKWFKERTPITDGTKYRVSIANGSNVGHFTFQLEIFDLNVHDYTEYRLSVTSRDNAAEHYVQVHLTEKFLPRILNYTTEVDRTGRISVNFTSVPNVTAIEWWKNGVVIERNDKYRIDLDAFHNVITLNIGSLDQEDFGFYMLAISNAAGTRTLHINLNQPEVFPLFGVCSQSESINISCVIRNCNEEFLPWIHSISGTTVRHIKGHVEGQINTLSISQCRASDVGRYACVTRKNTSEIPIFKASSQLEVYASPIMDNAASVTIQQGVIHISVNASSHPTPRYVKWFHNNVLVTKGNLVTEQSVEIPVRGTNVILQGYKLSLTISNYNNSNFGKYRVLVANTVGVADLHIQVDDPDQGIYVIQKKISISVNKDSAEIATSFYSFPKYQSVSWTNIETGASVVTSPRFSVTTNDPADHPRIYTSHLNISNLRISDFITYKLTIKNSCGWSEYFVNLENPEEGAPVIEDEAEMLIDGDTAIISVNFTSNPSIQFVVWYKDNVPLLSDRKYSILTQRQNLARRIHFGSVFPVVGYQTQLYISNINQSDYTTYRVEMKNTRGRTGKRIDLTADCT